MQCTSGGKAGADQAITNVGWRLEIRVVTHAWLGCLAAAVLGCGLRIEDQADGVYCVHGTGGLASSCEG